MVREENCLMSTRWHVRSRCDRRCDGSSNWMTTCFLRLDAPSSATVPGRQLHETRLHRHSGSCQPCHQYLKHLKTKSEPASCCIHVIGRRPQSRFGTRQLHQSQPLAYHLWPQFEFPSNVRHLLVQQASHHGRNGLQDLSDRALLRKSSF